MKPHIKATYEAITRNLPPELEEEKRHSNKKRTPHLLVKKRGGDLVASVCWFNGERRKFYVVFWPYPNMIQTKAKRETPEEVIELLIKILIKGERNGDDKHQSASL